MKQWLTFFLLMSLFFSSCSVLQHGRGHARAKKGKETSIVPPKFTLHAARFSPDKFRISGQLLDYETEEPLIFASVALYHYGVLIGGTESDFDGNFWLDADYLAGLNPEELEVHTEYVGYEKNIISGFTLQAGDHLEMQIRMVTHSNWGELPPFPIHYPPLIRIDDMGSGKLSPLTRSGGVPQEARKFTAF